MVPQCLPSVKWLLCYYEVTSQQATAENGKTEDWSFMILSGHGPKPALPASSLFV